MLNCLMRDSMWLCSPGQYDESLRRTSCTSLQRIRRWLRPGGRVLDIHPEPEAASVEIRPAERLIPVGPFDRLAIYDKIDAARATLDEMTEAGLYVRERSVNFEVLYHFESVYAWLTYRADRGSTTEVPQALQTRARKILAATSGELLVREQMRAIRYRRRVVRSR
jgi:hypothetical protein